MTEAIAEPSRSNTECSICHQPYDGTGHEAWPVNIGRACNTCHDLYVLPARIQEMYNQDPKPVTVDRGDLEEILVDIAKLRDELEWLSKFQHFNHLSAIAIAALSEIDADIKNIMQAKDPT